MPPPHSAMIKVKAWFLARFLRLQCRTWRVEIKGREHLDRLYSQAKPILVCFWHGKYVPIFPLMEGYAGTIISSQSDRGNVIAEICRHFGYQSTQIAEQATRESLKQMGGILAGVQVAATALDGPLGPYHRIKHGILRTALDQGFTMLPVTFSCRRKIVLKHRWDRLELPLPFTRICLSIGEPISLPVERNHRRIRSYVDRLGESLTALDDQASRRVRSAAR